MGKSVDHAQRREIFAAAALRVIMRDGIAGLTVREVAKEAGFTTGALTHYFHSKDQLLIEASEHSALLVRARMERAEKTRPALEAIRKVVALALPLTAETRGYWRIWVGYWERSSYDDEVSRVMQLRYDEWRGRLAALLARAQAEVRRRARSRGMSDLFRSERRRVRRCSGVSSGSDAEQGRCPAGQRHGHAPVSG